MENEKPDMPQKKPKVNLSKEPNSGTDISTGKEKNWHSIFRDVIAGMFRGFYTAFAGIFEGFHIAISTIRTFFADLYYKYFSFIKVDISQLGDIESAALIRKKMRLSLLEGGFYLCFLALAYLQFTGNLPFSFLAYCGLIAAFVVMHFSFSLLVCNISKAGSDLFKRFNRSDFIEEFAHVESIWRHQLRFFIILTLMILPLFLVIETEFVKNLIQNFANVPILIQGFKIWCCYLLIIFFYNYSFSLFYCLVKFFGVYNSLVNIEEIEASAPPLYISGKKPMFFPSLLVHIMALMLIMYCQYSVPLSISPGAANQSDLVEIK